MLGLVSPEDLMNSVLSANRLAPASGTKSRNPTDARIPPTFEEVLQSGKISSFKAETAIMKVMDMGRDRADEEERGRKRTALDFIGEATVASAVSALYAKNSRMKLDFSSATPFAPASAIENALPQPQALVKQALKENFAGSGEEKEYIEALIDETFPDDPTLDPMGSIFSGDENSAASEIARLTRTIPPMLAKALGFGNPKTRVAKALPV